MASLDSQGEDNCKIVPVELPDQKDTLIWVGTFSPTPDPHSQKIAY